MNTRSRQDDVTLKDIPQSDGRFDIDTLVEIEISQRNLPMNNTRPDLFERETSASDDAVLTGLHAELPRICHCGCTVFTDDPLVDCLIEYRQHGEAFTD